MTKKKTEMTPEQHSRTKALALAWRQANREQINARQRAKRASERDARKYSQPVVSQEEAERVKTEKRAAIAAYKQQWRLENIDRVRARRKAAYQSNKSAAVASASAWNRANAERRKEIVRRHEQNNPEMRRAIKARRRARERGAEGSFSAQDLQSIVERQLWLCAACGCCLRLGYEADHIQPLARGGSNWPENIQALCRTCNRSKGAKHPQEFKRQIQAKARYVRSPEVVA